MTTLKQYEKQDAFPMAHIQCLKDDLVLILKKGLEKKNKDKIEILSNIALETIVMHLGELSDDLEKTDTRKQLYDKYEILFTDKENVEIEKLKKSVK